MSEVFGVLTLFIAGIFLAAVGAGLLGALVGLGGGILIVPLLTIGFGLDIRLAIGASIVSVIATSSGAAAAYVRDHLTNVRVAMFLELATSLGAITGALVATHLNPRAPFLPVRVHSPVLDRPDDQEARRGDPGKRDQ